MPLPKRRTRPERSTDPVFRILTVCTGNICRSPQAEQLLRVRLPEAFGRDSINALVVTSAGTNANDDDRIDPYAAEQMERLGIPGAAEHRARRLGKQQVQSVDLVLGMERRHRDVAAGLRAAVPAHIFTLVELTLAVELLAGASGARVAPLGPDGFAAFMRRVVDAAHGARAEAKPRAAIALDIADPHRYGPEVYRRSADAIDDAASRLAAGIRALAVDRSSQARSI